MYAEQSMRAGKYDKSDGRILGIRYKSMTRPNFDICETCEARDGATTSTGPFMKLYKQRDFDELMLRMDGSRFISYG
jgi:hypothetical protein